MARRASCSLWLLAVVAAALVPAGEAIRCYVCTTVQDPNCGDPFTASDKALECTPELVQKWNDARHQISDMLTKMGIDIPRSNNNQFECQKLKRKINNSEVTIRTCTMSSDVASVCETERSEGNICSQCAQDLCNGAPAVAAALFPLLLALLPAAAALFLRP